MVYLVHLRTPPPFRKAQQHIPLLTLPKGQVLPRKGSKPLGTGCDRIGPTTLMKSLRNDPKVPQIVGSLQVGLRQNKMKWLWVKKKGPRDHRFWFVFPFTTRVFYVPIFDSQPIWLLI